MWLSKNTFLGMRDVDRGGWDGMIFPKNKTKKTLHSCAGRKRPFLPVSPHIGKYSSCWMSSMISSPLPVPPLTVVRRGRPSSPELNMQHFPYFVNTCEEKREKVPCDKCFFAPEQRYRVINTHVLQLKGKRLRINLIWFNNSAYCVLLTENKRQRKGKERCFRAVSKCLQQLA